MKVTYGEGSILFVDVNHIKGISIEKECTLNFAYKDGELSDSLLIESKSAETLREKLSKIKSFPMLKAWLAEVHFKQLPSDEFELLDGY